MITNSGSVAGTDVVQLYLHENDTTILQPVKKLEGFQRVTLAPGQTKTVTFTLAPRTSAFSTNRGSSSSSLVRSIYGSVIARLGRA